MKTCPMLAAMFLTCAMAQSATAKGFDAGEPFICVPINIVSCQSGGQCSKETADTVNLPQFLRFDIAGSQITGTRPSGEPLATLIDDVKHVAGNLALVGVENDIVWSILITETSGDMLLTAAGDGTGYIAFGSCTDR